MHLLVVATVVALAGAPTTPAAQEPAVPVTAPGDAPAQQEATRPTAASGGKAAGEDAAAIDAGVEPAAPVVKVEVKAVVKPQKPVDLKPRILFVVQHALLGGAVALAVTQCIILLGAAMTLWFIPRGNPLDDRMPSEWRGAVAVLFLLGVVPGSLALAGMGVLAAVISAVRGWPEAFGGG